MRTIPATSLITFFDEISLIAILPSSSDLNADNHQ